MSNIRISALSFVDNPALLRVYDTYIKVSDTASRARLQQKLERVLAQQVYGAKKVPGNPRLVQDYYIDESKAAIEVSKNLGVFELDNESGGILRIEAKLQRKLETSRTRTVIGTAQLDSSVLGSSILNEIIASTQKNPNNPNIASKIFQTLRQVKSGTNLFNFLAKNAPTSIHEPAYQKSKNLTIFSRTEGSLNAYQIFFPRSKFKAPIFGSYIDRDGSISYFIQTSFEKQIVSRAKDAMLSISFADFKEQQQLSNSINSIASRLKTAKTIPTTISFGGATKTKPRATEKIDLIYYTTNSIPMSRGIVKSGQRLNFSPEEPQQKELPEDSFIDVTIAVQRRTRQKMRRGTGKPRPPNIYERTGTFRNSIRAYFNVRQNVVDYFYEPYYQRLERSGYEVGALVEDSIRSAMQSQFKRQVTTRRIEL
jgi:hypothetical protein